MSQLRLGRGELALGGIQGGLPRVHLRGRRQIFALGVIDFLLGHNAGLSFENSVQARVFQMQRLVLRLIARQFVVRAGDLIVGVLDLRLIFLRAGLAIQEFPERP